MNDPDSQEAESAITTRVGSMAVTSVYGVILTGLAAIGILARLRAGKGRNL